jgi:hypothetical protein
MHVDTDIYIYIYIYIHTYIHIYTHTFICAHCAPVASILLFSPMSAIYIKYALHTFF